MKRIERTESFNTTPAPASTITAKIPVGFRYHQFLFNVALNGAQATLAQIVAGIEELRFIADGKVFRTIKPKHLFYLLALNKHEFNSGMMPVYFEEPWRSTVGDQGFLALGTGGLSTLEVQVKWANYNSGTSAYSARLVSVSDNAIDPKTGMAVEFKEFIKWNYLTYGITHVSSDGVIKITDLPKLDTYCRLHFFPSDASVSVKDAEIAVDGQVVKQAKMIELDEILSSYELDPVAADAVLATHGDSIIFDNTQRIGDSLLMQDPASGARVSRFEISLNVTNGTASTQQIELLMETFGNR